MILQFRFSNSGFSPAMYPSSVVQTGVKFFGCENRTAHPFPIHSWKVIRPCVVSAVKLGASLLILNDMTHLRMVKTVRSSLFPVSGFSGAEKKVGSRLGHHEPPADLPNSASASCVPSRLRGVKPSGGHRLSSRPA